MFVKGQQKVHARPIQHIAAPIGAGTSNKGGASNRCYTSTCGKVSPKLALVSSTLQRSTKLATHVVPSAVCAACSAASSSSVPPPGRRPVTPRAAAAAELTRERNWSLRATKSVSLLICKVGELS